jgi:hypothetical protein
MEKNVGGDLNDDELGYIRDGKRRCMLKKGTPNNCTQSFFMVYSHQMSIDVLSS